MTSIICVDYNSKLKGITSLKIIVIETRTGEVMRRLYTKSQYVCKLFGLPYYDYNEKLAPPFY